MSLIFSWAVGLNENTNQGSNDFRTCNKKNSLVAGEGGC